MIIGIRELALIVGTLTHEPSLSVAPDQFACLARNIYHEARSEGYAGMAAVGYVTAMRLETGRWGATLCEVVEAPKQFSWHSDGLSDQPTDMTAYNRALRVATDVLTGRAVDASRRATHYYAHDLVLPVWASSLTPTATIGGHTFLTTCAAMSAAPECAPTPPPKPAGAPV